MSPRYFPLLLTAALTVVSCASPYGRVSFNSAPQIINVSEYDPKERQRAGHGYTPLNQKALKDNGALGLIARGTKAGRHDSKCGDFLSGAERQGMLLGSYCYVVPSQSATYQASRFLRRLSSIKKNYSLQTQRILLVADFDTKCSANLMVGFVDEIYRHTGIHPVVYLENGPQIRNTLNRATYAQRSRLRLCPYWLALYTNGYNRFETPRKLALASGVWSDWCMWQYSGVFWENGRSKIYNYNGGSWNTPKYFGSIDRPMERNGFNGTTRQLYAFWNKHSWAW
ncbi:GH25 family lysozyme [Rubritalea spongiae]|uniref:GH25 family lysozyme n=1 Tax=Rubritalea spongiae TaxID=430797 RepID=A0ABW5E182_9BACT